MFLALERAGYKKGLTYQSLPYNYIKSYRNNELKKTFVPNLERISKLTGKKVIIFAHSYGNLNVLHQLSLLEQSYKDKYIKNWIAATPPWLGAMQATKCVLGGDDEYFYLKFIGFHFDASSKSLGSFPCMYEMMQRNMYSIYENEPWFKWIQKRLDYEAGKIPFKDSEMLFWPTIGESCTPESFTGKSTKCFSGLDDLRKRPSITVEDGDHEYYLDDNLKLVKDWPLLEKSVDYFKMFDDTNFRKLKNPGVPLLLIFSKSNDTIVQTNYKGKITDYTKNDKYPKATDVMGFGDGTVGTNSKLFPAIKWAYEFENKDSLGDQAKDYKVKKTLSELIN
jgi:hypothetical protein